MSDCNFALNKIYRYLIFYIENKVNKIVEIHLKFKIPTDSITSIVNFFFFFIKERKH